MENYVQKDKRVAELEQFFRRIATIDLWDRTASMRDK